MFLLSFNAQYYKLLLSILILKQLLNNSYQFNYS